MALVATKIKDDNFGTLKIQIYDLSFASVTAGKIATGLQNILHADYSPTTTDDHGIVYKNYSDTGSTTAPGSVYIDGVGNSDKGSLIVYGN